MVTVMLCLAGIETGRRAPVPPAGLSPEVRPLTPVVSRTLAARPGADSTSVVVSARWPTSASMPCACRAGAAAVIAPGAPARPPGIATAAVTGTLDFSTTAPATPDSDVRSIRLAEPAGMSIAVAPVGWYVPAGETTVRLTCASLPPASAT
jgi:hypothetical protein